MAARRRICQGMILLALFGAAVYGNSLKGKLFWDDEETVVRNVFIRSPSHLKDILLTTYHAGSGKRMNAYRPLATASFMLEYQLWRLRPLGYHLTNLFLHILNTWLVLLLFDRLFEDGAVSFLAAALFLIHPINTEAVNYVSNRTDLLLLFFTLCGFFSYLFYRTKGKGIFLIGCMVCYCAAIFSKEAGLAVPLLFLAYERFLKSPPRKIPIFPSLIFLAIVIGYAFLRTQVLHLAHLDFLGPGVSLKEGFQHPFLRLLAFAEVLSIYLKLFFFPVGLHMEYDPLFIRSVLDAQAWRAAGAVCSFVGFLWWWGRKDKRVTFGMAWFLVGLLPVSGIVPMTTVIAEHFTYPASPGIFCAAAAVWMRLLVWQRVQRIRPLLVGVGAGILLVLGTMTAVRNQVWADPLAFYLDVIQKTEHSYKASNNAGMEYFRRGDIEKAEEYFKRALKIHPADPVVLNNLGLICYKRGDQDGEELYYRSAIQIHPTYVVARRNLANLYIRQKKYAQAAEQLQKAVEYYPDDPEARTLQWAIPKEFKKKAALPAVDEAGQHRRRQP